MRRRATLTAPLLLVGCAVVVAAALWAQLVTPAHGASTTGATWLRECKIALTAIDTNNVAGIEVADSLGLCVGAMYALHRVSPFLGICIPQGAGNVQLMRVVVASLERHPHSLHHDFIGLALAALMAAYPCGEE